MSITQTLFDRTRLLKHLTTSHTPTDDFITALIHDDLAERLGAISRTFTKALMLAPAQHHLLRQLETPSGSIHFETRTTLGRDGAMPDLADVDSDYDLVVSLYDLAIVDDVQAWLDDLRARLKPDGLLFCVFPGGLTLTELRQAALAADAEILGGAVLRVAPMIDTREAGVLLQNTKLGLPVADVETHTIRYADPLALLRDMRALGAGNPLQPQKGMSMGRTHLGALLSHYQDNFADPDGRIRATLELIWMSGWKPHDSQQKPLKPGSASARLADILKDKSKN